jgi:transcriptional regulator
MGQRLLAMEKRLLEEPQKADQKIDYYNDDDFQPYSQAAQLFKMGLDAEEVARRCGLSRAEASLIQMMQMKSDVK